VELDQEQARRHGCRRGGGAEGGGGGRRRGGNGFIPQPDELGLGGGREQPEDQDPSPNQNAAQSDNGSAFHSPTLNDNRSADKLGTHRLPRWLGRQCAELTPLEAKTTITRVGPGTKIVSTGDPYQIDSSSNGFNYVVSRFREHAIAAHIL